MRTVPLGNLATLYSGGTPSKKIPEYFQGNIPWITGADIHADGHIKARDSISQEAVEGSATRILDAGTIVLVSRTSVGKVGILNEPTAISQDITGISAGDCVDPKYLCHFLSSISGTLSIHARGATIKGITRDVVSRIKVPLPPLDEQRRIAAILDQASSIGQHCLTQFDLANRLKSSLINSQFQSRTNDSAPLSSIAHVSSGITKGRKTNADTRLVPYLAVANVQDGFLDLSNIKEIAATDGEISRYELAPGDLVLTEGGDPDKLGRGTVWRGEIKSCIHQNHIFRVRMKDDSTIRPDVLSAFMRSTTAKSYFLRSAKQTTGIASINMTQLKSLPVPRLTPQAQLEFSNQVQAIDQKIDELEKRLSVTIALERSLQASAFRGEL